MQAVLPLTEKLYVYGPLGIICALLILAVGYLYISCQNERRQHEADLKAERDKHAQEMGVFQERYVTKAESWMKQYFDLASAQDDTMSAQKELFEQLMKQAQGQRGFKGG